jgi:hypothetical protein
VLGAVAAVIVIVIALGWGGRRGTRAAPARSTATAPAKAAPSGASTAGSPATPAGAVQAFYQRAASHRYDEAWALAGPGVRAQLGGLDAFRGQFATLRSISFSRAQATSQAGDSATVSIATTAVHTDRTDRCAGTVDLVPGDEGWVLQHISVSC